MNMTPEQIEQWKDACDAMRDGERIQVQLLSGEWADTVIFDPRLPHRRKPKPDPLAALKALHASGVRIEARKYPPESHAWHYVENPNWSLDFEWRAVLCAPPHSCAVVLGRKLAKCREALGQIAAATVMRSHDAGECIAAEHRDCARETLDATE
jgi:hypothetical protein